MRIVLTRNKVAIVDEIDSDLAKFNWIAHKKGTKLNPVLYAVRNDYTNKPGKPIFVAMHRVILERVLGRKLEISEWVDHIDHDGLNNRRSNLRLSTRTQNLRNRRMDASMNGVRKTSKYKGVYWNKDMKKWHAQIKLPNRRKHIGYFSNEEEAARAYDKYAKLLFESYCSLNFPDQ